MGPDLRLQRVLDRVELVSGIGEPDEGTMCVMSLVADLAGEGRTDRPGCASPPVRAFVIPVNDGMPREVRQRLKPFAPRLMGTDDGLDRARAELLRRALVETILPRVSGDRRVFSPGEPAWRTGPFGDLRMRLLRGRPLRRIGRLWAEAERGRRRPGLEAETASATGRLLGLCARDAWDTREAEWCWNRAIGLLDRLCGVGERGLRGARGACVGGTPRATAGSGRLTAPLGTGRCRGRPPRQSGGG